MADETVFVGREDELRQWARVVASPEGQAVLVVGQEGIGKTLLLKRMVDAAMEHPDLKCGSVRYEVTPTDSVDGILIRMINDAYQAAHRTEGSFSGTKKRREQWRAFLNVFQVGDLWMSLRSQDQRGVREQFLGTLERVSEKMPENGRAIFVIDPEKYMQEDSDQAWAIVIRDLPPKVKVLFAQRPDDVLASSDIFRRLGNVQRIPKDDLSVLEDDAVDELIGIRLGNAGISLSGVREAVRRYEGHPYAVDAALRLIGDGVALTSLPSDPSRIAAGQWQRMCKHGAAAVRLFEAYAILEVPVPDEVVEPVSGVSRPERLALVPDPFLGGLLRDEAEGRRIYHGLVADHIRDQISEIEAKPYHERAAKVYRKRLHAGQKPDALAARRLPDHVLAAEGEVAFVRCFVSECWKPLRTLGLLDAAFDISQRILRMVPAASEEEAIVLNNLGLIYTTRGELDRAEEIYQKALSINVRLARPKGTAKAYANLGTIHRTRGELDKAEEMHLKALDIEKGLGRLEGVASAYNDLGLVYQTRGELDRAEEMHRKSLAIAEQSGNLDVMAKQYGNLGVLYQTRGELDTAEEMLRKALEIDERLGSLEGMASWYGDLGIVYHTRGQLDKAEHMHLKSLAINQRLGRLEGMARDYVNLGVVHALRGELGVAEEMYQKALSANARLGRLEGMAKAYLNLGGICQARGDPPGALEYCIKARELFQRIGMVHMVEEVQKLIDGLPEVGEEETDE